jgi:hypothetical protein
MDSQEELDRLFAEQQRLRGASRPQTNQQINKPQQRVPQSVGPGPGSGPGPAQQVQQVPQVAQVQQMSQAPQFFQQVQGQQVQQQVQQQKPYDHPFFNNVEEEDLASLSEADADEIMREESIDWFNSVLDDETKHLLIYTFYKTFLSVKDKSIEKVKISERQEYSKKLIEYKKQSGAIISKQRHVIEGQTYELKTLKESLQKAFHEDTLTNFMSKIQVNLDNIAGKVSHLVPQNPGPLDFSGVISALINQNRDITCKRIPKTAKTLVAEQNKQVLLSLMNTDVLVVEVAELTQELFDNLKSAEEPDFIIALCTNNKMVLGQSTYVDVFLKDETLRILFGVSCLVYDDSAIDKLLNTIRIGDFMHRSINVDSGLYELKNLTDQVTNIQKVNFGLRKTAENLISLIRENEAAITSLLFNMSNITNNTSNIDFKSLMPQQTKVVLEKEDLICLDMIKHYLVNKWPRITKKDVRLAAEKHGISQARVGTSLDRHLGGLKNAIAMAEEEIGRGILPKHEMKLPLIAPLL